MMKLVPESVGKEHRMRLCTAEREARMKPGLLLPSSF